MPFPWSAPASRVSLPASHRQQHQADVGGKRHPVLVLVVRFCHPWDSVVSSHLLQLRGPWGGWATTGSLPGL